MKKILALFLTLTLCVTTIPAYAAASDSSPSSWAVEEVNKALSMGFVPERLQSNYQQEITRDEFAELAVRFCEYQFGYAFGIDDFLRDYRAGHVDASGNTVKAESEAFIDATHYGTIASALGITNGKGGGKFDPNGSITRQEAATMLLRAYTAYSAHIPNETIGAENYIDSNLFPSWAADSIMRLKSWSVMKGDGDNTFNPTGHYTREQSIMTFLRLDEYAPYGRSRSNLKPLVSYEESICRILSPEGGASFALTARYDKPDATILLGTEQAANGDKTPRLWVVYTGISDIGQKDLYPCASKNFPNTYTIGDITFNDSGSTMYYTVKLGEIGVNCEFALNLINAIPAISQSSTDKLQQLPTVFDSLTITGFDGEYIYTVSGDGKPSVYDLKGNLLLAGNAGTFSQAGEGLFMLLSSAGVCYYTAQGEILNNTTYAAGTVFNDGVAAVQKEASGGITIIDKTGAAVKTISSQGGKIIDTSFEANCIRLTMDSTNLLMNITTRTRTAPQYIDVLPFSNGYAAVLSEKDGWGYIKEDFSVAIPCQYEWAKSFQSIGFAPVANKNLKVGVISSYKSMLTIPFEYKNITEFTSYGYALGERDSGQCVLLSLQTPINLPAGDFNSFRLYGKYVAQETTSGYTMLDSTGTPLFPGTTIQAVYGYADSDIILIKSDGHLYLYKE